MRRNTKKCPTFRKFNTTFRDFPVSFRQFFAVFSPTCAFGRFLPPFLAQNQASTLKPPQILPQFSQKLAHMIEIIFQISSKFLICVNSRNLLLIIFRFFNQCEHFYFQKFRCEKVYRRCCRYRYHQP